MKPGASRRALSCTRRNFAAAGFSRKKLFSARFVSHFPQSPSELGFSGDLESSSSRCAVSANEGGSSVGVLSPRLINEIWRARQQGRRAYQIALLAGLHPSVFSGITNNSVPVKTGDARVVRIGALFGLTPSECFTQQNKTGAAA